MVRRVLVVGATGLLGALVARKLVESGGQVRGMSRDPARLRGLVGLGLEACQGDLLRPDTLTAACRDVDQIFSTANSFMGRGPSSPTRVDVPGYGNLLACAKAAGVRRLVHTSAYGVSRESSVDYFRIKAEIDELIRRSGLPYVLLRPAAFLDVWAGMILSEAQAGRPVRVFGDGRRAANLVAAADVAEVAVRVLARPEVVNQGIDVGGPSTLSQLELIEKVEAALGRPLARRHIPLAVLRIGAVVMRPFNELTARFMSLGAWSAGADRLLDHWGVAAAAYGVEPMAAEAYLDGVAGR